MPSSVFDAEVARQNENNDWLKRADGKENPYVLCREMGKIMTNNVTVVRYNDKLRETDVKIQELMARYRNIGVPDKSGWANQPLLFQPPAVEHARAGAGDYARRAAPRREPGRALQARLPQAQRRAVAEDHDGPFRRATPRRPRSAIRRWISRCIPPRPRDYSGKAKHGDGNRRPAAGRGNGNTATVAVAPARQRQRRRRRGGRRQRRQERD